MWKCKTSSTDSKVYMKLNITIRDVEDEVAPLEAAYFSEAN